MGRLWPEADWRPAERRGAEPTFIAQSRKLPQTFLGTSRWLEIQEFRTAPISTEIRSDECSLPLQSCRRTAEQRQREQGTGKLRRNETEHIG